jgi:phosphotransferase system enzyme I (PtsI)
MLVKEEEFTLKGTPIGRGVAIGIPFYYNREELNIFELCVPPAYTQREIERYREALTRSKQDIKRLQKQLEMESAADGVMVLEGQLEMLKDPMITVEIEKEIQRMKRNAEFVFQQFLINYQKNIEKLEDPFFMERFKDLEDLSRRVFGYLNQSGSISLYDVPPNSIVCATELTASDIASANLRNVTAFVTELGGVTTHAAIVAKARGIPYITNINLEYLKRRGNGAVIVDGRDGKLILNPSEETLEEYTNLSHHIDRQVNTLKKMTQWPAQTFDGYSIRLCANLDMLQEVELIREFGGQGIGLFRSEYIFLPENEIPSENEQYQVYRRIVEEMQELPVVIRTFDLGGDKIAFNHAFINERNPFIGSRGTRFFLKEKDIFKVQLRAILRASVHGNVRILFPMISTLSELLEAKQVIAEVREELQLFHPIRIGCMIEVPSAALIVDHFSQECDFLSIGTNDLVQYALAIDRSNHELSAYYAPTDPSVIRLIKLITTEANKANIPVSVCGEIASDPRFTALLLGLGIQELSVAPRYLPIIKNAIRNTSIVDAVALAERALGLSTAEEILTLITDDYKKNVPNDLFYNFTQTS